MKGKSRENARKNQLGQNYCFCFDGKIRNCIFVYYIKEQICKKQLQLMMRSFEHWEYEEIELTFGVNRAKKLPTLETWLTTDMPIEDWEKKAIDRLQARLMENADNWQEDEIKSFFNIPLIDIVNFFGENEQYKTFTQRILSGKLPTLEGKEIDLQGRVELLVATGKQKPRQPFFFLNEYKPQLKGKNDPLGQLLIAMLVAQSKNANEKLVHGVYVIGKFWNFVVLEGKNYAISESYIATSDDIYRIFQMLKTMKEYVEKHFQ